MASGHTNQRFSNANLIGSTFHCIEGYVGLGEARIWGVRGSYVRLRGVWLRRVMLGWELPNKGNNVVMYSSTL